MGNKIKNWFVDITNFNKGVDQKFLNTIIYPELSSYALIHSNSSKHEPLSKLTSFRKTTQNKLYCGQVHRYNKNKEQVIKYDMLVDIGIKIEHSNKCQNINCLFTQNRTLNIKYCCIACSKKEGQHGPRCQSIIYS